MFDFIAITLCVIISLVIGLRASRGMETCRDFILTDRKFTTFTIVSTIFPLMIGSGNLLRETDEFYKIGLISLIFYAGFAAQAVLFLFISKRIRNYTQAMFPGDIMRDAYGKRGQKIFGICTCFWAFGNVFLSFTTINYIFTTFFKVDHPILCVFMICLVVTSYCALGGVKAVTLADVFYLLVFVVAFPIIASIVLNKSGGLMNVIDHIPPGHLCIFDHHEFWKYVALFFWCAIPSDVGVMHRIMLAKSVEQANQALKISAVLYFPLVALVAIFGFCSLTVFGNVSKDAFSQLLGVTLPCGFNGLVAIGFVTVFMSVFATNLNFLAISFTRDIIKPFLNISISDKNELLAMRVMTVVFMAVIWLVYLVFDNPLNAIDCEVNATIHFDNVFTTIVFPSMIMLLIGFSYSQKAFLAGVVVSITALLSILISGNEDALTYLTWPIIALNIGIMYVVNKCKFTKNTGK